MISQSYSNHIRYYYPHHFIFYPVVFVAAGVSSYFFYEEQRLVWLAITGIFLLLAWLSFMVRQHYALVNQDRIVRLELRLRYYILTQQRLELVEQQLSFKKLAALRFASDEEFVPLLNRALKEKLSADEIKKSIEKWQADHMRV
jgi:hypothetical protein